MKKSACSFLLYGACFIYQAIQLVNMRTHYDLILLNHQYNVIYLFLLFTISTSLMYHVFKTSFIKSSVTRDKMLSFFAKKDDEYDRFIQENAKENYYKVRKASFVLTIILAMIICILSVITIIQNINNLISKISNFTAFIIITLVLITLALASQLSYKKTVKIKTDDNKLRIFDLLMIANISIIIFNLQTISDI